MKAYTDIAQSKKLVEILPIESADMFWMHVEEKSPKIDFWKVETIQRNFKPYSMNIPCWSLSALLDLLPNQFNKCTKTLYWFNNTWHCDYMDEDSESEISMSADNPVDACVEMLFELKRLIDNNLL